MQSRYWFAVLVVVALVARSPAGEPGGAQIDWVKKNVIPFKTVKAEGGFEDLAALKELIGDARIVSLGESTHGSREIFQMKHRLVEFLAAEMDFTIFSIEANMPESYRVNDYVLGGEGDPKRLIGGMYFWTWDTEEVLEMVEWMRRFNDGKKGRIEFTGFDMQTPDVAMRIVLDFLAEHEKDAQRACKEAYARAARTTRSGGGGGGFGVATGSFPLDAARGKRVEYSGWIKTENVDTFAGLWWRVDGPDGKTLAFDNMGGTGPRGTKDWKAFSINLDVPKEAVNINFGLLMPGKGKSWFDGLQVLLDGEKYENEKLFDFDFEADEVKGLMIRHQRNYRGRLDKGVAKAGKQSLLLESVDAPEPEEGLPAEEGLKAATEVLERLIESRDALARKSDEEQVDWVIQNARLVAQCMETRVGGVGVNVRDRSMAENVAWILKQNPKAKIVLWAHNGHISKQPQAMGKFLDDRFGEEYLAIAFATSKGKYQAIRRGEGLSENELAEPPQSSVEDVFCRTGLPRFVLDLRKAAADSAESGWLTKSVPFRSIGALAMESQFGPQNLSEYYDAVIYIEETSRARPIARGD